MYSVSDYAKALLNLLPQGRLWDKTPVSNLSSLMTALAGAPSRVDARGQQLIAEAFPSTTNELLAEWEATLGLPDACSGAGQTPDQRRALVVARFTDDGSQSVPYLTAYAASIGFEIDIIEFAPFRLGASSCGDPITGPEAPFLWQVRAPGTTTTLFQMGQNAMGDALGTFGNQPLSCAMSSRKPAHTQLFLTFG